MKVFISAGFPESRWHTKRFMPFLEEQGFEMTHDMSEADIIIAHSGGCYMLNSQKAAKLILLIGLPYWPGKNLISCLAGKVKLEKKDKRFFEKTLFSVFYGIIYIPKWIIMLRAYLRKDFDVIRADKVLLIHNEQDTFMNSKESQKISKQHGWQYVSMPGQHDDLWDNPGPYISLAT